MLPQAEIKAYLVQTQLKSKKGGGDVYRREESHCTGILLHMFSEKAGNNSTHT